MPPGSASQENKGSALQSPSSQGPAKKKQGTLSAFFGGSATPPKPKAKPSSSASTSSLETPIRGIAALEITSPVAATTKRKAAISTKPIPRKRSSIGGKDLEQVESLPPSSTSSNKADRQTKQRGGASNGEDSSDLSSVDGDIGESDSEDRKPAQHASKTELDNLFDDDDDEDMESVPSAPDDSDADADYKDDGPAHHSEDEDLPDVVSEEEPPTEEDDVEDDEPVRPKKGKKSTPTPRAPTLLSSSTMSHATPFSQKSQGSSILRSQQEAKEQRAKDFKQENIQRYSWLLNPKDSSGIEKGKEGYDPRSLLIPSSAWHKFTPFEQQFWEIKSQNFDTVVFFKKGKFYELYEEDADIGHQRFGLKLTDRVNMRMVGVPESGFAYWAGKFVSNGYRVARVEQMETALGMEMRQKGGAAKGGKSKVVRRELAAVLTAGTLTDEGLLSGPESTFCMAIKEGEEKDGTPYIGVCFVDTSTAEFWLCGFLDDADRTRLETLLTQVRPREIVLESGNTQAPTLKTLKGALETRCIWNKLKPAREFWHSGQTWLELTSTDGEDGGYFGEKGVPESIALYEQDTTVLSAVGGLLSYLRSLKLDRELLSMGNVHLYGDPLEGSHHLVLDGQTLVNLEIFSSGKAGSDEGSLFRELNRCSTPFGKRLFRRWVCHPLGNKRDIEERLDAVELLMQRGSPQVRAGIAQLPDLERLLARIHGGQCQLKVLLQVLGAFARLARWIQEVEAMMEDGAIEGEEHGSALLTRLLSSFPRDLGELVEELEGTFDAGAAAKGEVVPPPGVEEDYDAVNAEVEKLEEAFAAHLAKCRKDLGCPRLQYRDIGREIRQIEVPKADLARVPGSWVRQSQTQQVSRYWNAEVRTLVRRWEEVQEVRNGVMRELQSRLYGRFDRHYTKWAEAVRVVGEVDCLWGLALFSGMMQEPKCRPSFGDGGGSKGKGGPVGGVDVRGLRHPCLAGKNSNFIPNDTVMGVEEAEGMEEVDGTAARIILLTGPNMGGKSTLLRQVCLAVVMGQLGCYVPAEMCRLPGGPVDRIFTRIGASDNILAGQSTFMVELTETARILSEATPRSLVILDELGRGTSTFDGYAIAYAVLHYLAAFSGCIGLFSTHYSSLVEEMAGHAMIRAQYMASEVDAEQNEVTFLYQLVDGKSPSSYGMNVARLAGIPEEIVASAEVQATRFEATVRGPKEERQSATGALTLAHQAHLAYVVEVVRRMREGGNAGQVDRRTLYALSVIHEMARRTYSA